MSKVELKAKVGADGVLKVRIPFKKTEANHSVRVTVEPLHAKSRKLSGRQWKLFLQETGGSILDTSFKRHEQGTLEDVEPLA